VDSRECWRRQFSGRQIEPIASQAAQVHEYNALTAAGICATQITGIICSAMMFAGMVLVSVRTKSNGSTMIRD
jgi:hypothetical protein